jgi:hypothetical protein
VVKEEEQQQDENVFHSMTAYRVDDDDDQSQTSADSSALLEQKPNPRFCKRQVPSQEGRGAKKLRDDLLQKAVAALGQSDVHNADDCSSLGMFMAAYFATQNVFRRCLVEPVAGHQGKEHETVRRNEEKDQRHFLRSRNAA